MDTSESKVHAVLIIDADHEELEVGGLADLTRYEVALYASIMFGAALVVVFALYLSWYLFTV